ncbi:hypothetical protein CRX22_10450 [Salmonella enterica subsp. enterica serovar Newport]|nr:hypothetical protein [Salmonella enterica subsp. enterica serovar Newport]
MKFRKKPVEIEAVCWDGKNDLEIMAFCPVCQFTLRNNVREMEIMTLEDGIDGRAVHIASVGDFIIQGVHGEFYACKPDIFDKTYEPV